MVEEMPTEEMPTIGQSPNGPWGSGLGNDRKPSPDKSGCLMM